MQLTRRQILQQGAGAAMLATAVRVFGEVAVEESSLPIIDTHQHLWDIKRFRLPWIGANDRVLNRTYSMADYLKAARGLNVVKAVYMEVAVEAGQRVAEAEYIIEICRRKDTPTVAAVIGGSPEAEGFRDYITRFKGSPFVKGVRAGYPSGGSENKQFLAGLRLLGKMGMSFDLLLGSDGFLDAANTAEQCPDTRFIVDHCGNPEGRLFGKHLEDDRETKTARDRWQRGMAELARRKNVVCKMSGIVENAPVGRNGAEDVTPVIDFCLNEFGPDRVMFDGNWPVCNRGGSFAGWVKLLREVVAGRGEAERRKLFHDNAEKFYGLSSRG
jgi:predicted TIM-barrel fold metal-dependent hydrolase